MRVIQGKNQEKGLPSNEEARNKLLAKVHIALKDLAWPDARYRATLNHLFGVPTAAALSVYQLAQLVEFFKGQGWKPKKYTAREGRGDFQLEAMRKQVKKMSNLFANGDNLLRNLCRKKFGVDGGIEWLHSEKQLKQLLAILGNMLRKKQEEKGDL